MGLFGGDSSSSNYTSTVTTNNSDQSYKDFSTKTDVTNYLDGGAVSGGLNTANEAVRNSLNAVTDNVSKAFNFATDNASNAYNISKQAFDSYQNIANNALQVNQDQSKAAWDFVDNFTKPADTGAIQKLGTYAVIGFTIIGIAWAFKKGGRK